MAQNQDQNISNQTELSSVIDSNSKSQLRTNISKPNSLTPSKRHISFLSNSSSDDEFDDCFFSGNEIFLDSDDTELEEQPFHTKLLGNPDRVVSPEPSGEITLNTKTIPRTPQKVFFGIDYIPKSAKVLKNSNFEYDNDDDQFINPQQTSKNLQYLTPNIKQNSFLTEIQSLKQEISRLQEENSRLKLQINSNKDSSSKNSSNDNSSNNDELNSKISELETIIENLENSNKFKQKEILKSKYLLKIKENQIQKLINIQNDQKNEIIQLKAKLLAFENETTNNNNNSEQRKSNLNSNITDENKKSSNMSNIEKINFNIKELYQKLAQNQKLIMKLKNNISEKNQKIKNFENLFITISQNNQELVEASDHYHEIQDQISKILQINEQLSKKVKEYEAKN